MSLFSGLVRWFKTIFGLAEGATQRSADSIVSGSPDAIRAQFRKTKEDWTKDYNQMREAVAELIRIREMRMDEIKKITKEVDDYEQKMIGAIELYKKNPDERFREAYAQLATKKEQGDTRIKELATEIDEQQKQLERYKSRLIEFQHQIEALSKEEAETVADIVSSQKIKELNDRLSGVSVDTQSKNLEAIRVARDKAKAVAKLSTELSGSDKTDLDKQLAAAGSGSKHLGSFDSLVGKSTPIKATENSPQALNPASSKNMATASTQNDVDKEIQSLLSGLDLKK